MTKAPDKDNGYTQIAHKAIEALALMKLTGGEFRMLFVVLRKTYGHHKKEDWISFGQFQKLTGLSRSSVIRAITSLEQLKILHVRREPYKTQYSFNESRSQWSSSVDDTSVTEDTSVLHATSSVDDTSVIPAHQVVAYMTPTKDILTKDTKVTPSELPKASEEFRLFIDAASKILGHQKTFTTAGLAKWRSRRKAYPARDIMLALANVQREPDRWKLKNNAWRPLTWWLRSDDYILELSNCHLKKSTRSAVFIPTPPHGSA